jgi:hypothetical protein
MRDELLTIMMEECAEVIVECSKIIRFGNDGTALAKELGDLQAMVDLAQRFDLVSYTDIEEQIPKKLNKLRSWSKLGGLINEVQSND